MASRRSRVSVLAACLSWVLFLMGALMLALVVWLSRTWAELSPDEIVFHLRASLSGTDTTVIKRFCLHYLPLVALACLANAFMRRAARGPEGLRRGFASALTSVVGLAMAGIALYGFADMVGIDYFLPGNGHDFVGEHYVAPDAEHVSFPEKKRNLVYLYLESMELTYADEAHGGAWDENLIPELTTLAEQDGETFAGDSDTLNGALVLPGCTWTMGGLFAQSSGLPLKVPTQGNQSWLALESFFPDLVCLGDLLEEQGYQQYALFGSDADFGNRRDYYTEHGGFDVFDYNRALEEGFIPEGYKVWWGFEDEKLFAKARETILDAAASGEPFNLTLLTVDTHFEDGYVCRLCETEHGDNQYANVMSCSSRQVAEFVSWLKDQDFYEDTTIVINGDHTTMDSDFCDDVDESYERRTFTTIINGAAEVADPTARRAYATLDLFPTTLAALGCTIEGDRLGVGTNLYGTTQTIIEEYGFEDCRRELSRRSEFLESFSTAATGAELVDRVLAEFEPNLSYRRAKSGKNTGFVLKEIHHFSLDMIENATLELTDTRTGKTKRYPMDVWRKNENRSTKYYLITRMDIPEDELVHYTAEAHVTISGDRDRVFARWSGAEAS